MHKHTYTSRVFSRPTPLPVRPSARRTLTIPTSLCYRNSLPSHKSAYQTHLSSTISLTTLRPQALQSQPVPDAWHLTVSVQPSKSSNTCSSLVLSDPLQVLGPRLYTWCLRQLLVIGAPVETTVPSTGVLFQIGPVPHIHDFSSLQGATIIDFFLTVLT